MGGKRLLRDDTATKLRVVESTPTSTGVVIALLASANL